MTGTDKSIPMIAYRRGLLRLSTKCLPGVGGDSVTDPGRAACGQVAASAAYSAQILIATKSVFRLGRGETSP